jgi:tetratricopeptide (TPR) repeat protein
MIEIIQMSFREPDITGLAAASQAGKRLLAPSLLSIAACLLSLTTLAHGSNTQIPQAPASAESQAQQHYDEAFRLQEDGQIAQADSEHKLFLAMALHYVANARANLGEYAVAVPLYDEALDLTPDDVDLHMDYAAAAVDGLDWKKAETLASTTVDLLKSKGEPPSPRTHIVLAQAMMGKGEYREAVEQFKIVAALKPGFESSYALARAYLALGNKSDAKKIFADLPAVYGDTASLHMKMGRLYGQAAFWDDAVEEFKAAIEKDRRLKGAHFSLGATYMMRSGETGYTLAEPELRKELELEPDQTLAYIALGRIEVVQHRFPEAEKDLNRAIELDPRSTAAYALLGQLYSESGKNAEAEAALRKQIALTPVLAKNDYEVQRAHFCLGRLLVKDGKVAEGHKELDISRDLLYQKAQEVESRLRGNAQQLQIEKTREASPDDLEQQKRIESQLGPMLASSYDNLAVHAAIGGDFSTAAHDFKRAAHWDSSIAGIDRKWGRAAFSTGDFSSAVAPLSRTLAANPEDETVRSMLGMSLFNTHDYAQAVRVLQPMEATLQSDASLHMAYVGSLAIDADSASGIASLQALETTQPESAEVHRLLGEAYASRKQYLLAAKELSAALRLDPSSAPAKHALALNDLALGDKADARKLLAELAKDGSKDPDVHYRLGCLQIESGSPNVAVESLKAAVRMNPGNPAYHLQLAEAYRQNEQPQEADLEVQKSTAAESDGQPPPELEDLLDG